MPQLKTNKKILVQWYFARYKQSSTGLQERMKTRKMLIQWYVVRHKEILQPVRNVLLILLAPLNVCQHCFLCLLLSPRSRTTSVFFVEAFQLERRKELQTAEYMTNSSHFNPCLLSTLLIQQNQLSSIKLRGSSLEKREQYMQKTNLFS